MNKFSKGRTFLVILVLLIGIFYSSPNLFPDTPVIQLNPIQTEVDLAAKEKEVQDYLNEKGVSNEIYKTDKKLFVKLKDSEKQAEANQLLTDRFGKEFYNALTIMPSTPRWLQSWGYKPITKGLDLRGGVSLLLQVDTAGLIKKLADSNIAEIASILDKEKISSQTYKEIENGGVQVELDNASDVDSLKFKVAKSLPDLDPVVDINNPKIIRFTVSETKIDELKSRAVEQNTITLRSRMNSIGVAEPSIQREGSDRISVQLPGLSDPADAKEALTSTASLEYYLVDEEATRTHKKRFDVKFINDESGNPIALKRKMIISGANIIDASSGADPQSGQNVVSVVLDSEGASRMGETTSQNLKKPMAVVYIEQIPKKSVDSAGKIVTTVEKKEVVISNAVIQSQFSKNFQTTGHFSRDEAQKLARTLRSGALVAPVYPIEERTIGPSAGKENIAMGFKSVVLGFVFVMVFMVFYYKKFGAISVVALIANLVLMLACLGIIGATLTLPGIAGIVLTLGMAVDANVLIYERIREEIDLGKSNMDSIRLGFDNAFSTIVDANITTFIAAAILFAFGTGPIQGFAVTLTIGILTSMFTAIIISRLIIHYLYENRDNDKPLSV